MSDIIHRIKDVLIMILIGIVVLLLLVLLCWILCIIFDKFCCCFNVNPNGPQYIQYNDIDRGSVARKARLWGISSNERLEIIKKILISYPYSSNKDVEEEQQDDCEMQVGNDILQDCIANNESSTITMGANVDDSYDVEGNNTNNNNNSSPNSGDIALNVDDVEAAAGGGHDDVLVDPGEEREEEDNQYHNDNNSNSNSKTTCCAICLVDYEDGVNVVTGTSCNHVFHYNCAIEWLTGQKQGKNGELCPCCRKEMIKPFEYRTAAKEILSPERFNALTSFYNNTNNDSRNNNNEADDDHQEQQQQQPTGTDNNTNNDNNNNNDT